MNQQRDITYQIENNPQGETLITATERFPNKDCLQIRINNLDRPEPTILETIEIKQGNWINSEFFFNYKKELVDQTQISCKKGSNEFIRGITEPNYLEKIKPKIEEILNYVSEHALIKMPPLFKT